ncbi:MAG: tetratricopeptide repeat protein [Spirochaetaceae bacterium]
MNPGRHFRRYRAYLSGMLFTLSVLSFLQLSSPAYSQSYRIQATPGLLIPLAGDRETFGIGGGGSVRLNAELNRLLAPWGGIQLLSIPPSSSSIDNSLLLTAAGGGLGLYSFPLPRVKVGASTGGGIYAGSYGSGEDALPTGNLYWQADAHVGFRISPGFTISAGGTYMDLRQETGSLYRGLSLTLSADFGIRSKSSEGRALLESADLVPVYPLLSREYEDREFGKVTIRNAESAEIRNVKVYFSVDGYTSSARLCGQTEYLPKNGEITFPLYASFSDQVMRVTEDLRTTGEVRIEYELLGEPRSSRGETTVSLHHRNAFTWEDPRILASFVSPNDQALLDLSKHVAGLVRSETRSEVDSNLQYALALFEGLKISGIAWSEDPQTPYREMHHNRNRVDYVQYPHQTISYRGGDSDDMAVLYAAAVESVGVPAALIPLEEDVLVAIKMASPEAVVRSFFTEAGEFLFIEGEAWIPVKISLLRDGFLRAWSEGARMVREEPEIEKNLYRLEDAWRKYPAAGVPDIRSTARKPEEEQVVRSFKNLVALVVEREVAPKAESRRRSFGPDGGTGRQRNALGVLYARYGVYEKALEEFREAADAGYRRAHINIGNVAFLLGEYETALNWYERVNEQYPDNPAAVIGLARTYYELDQYDQADFYFDIATQMEPELADRYSYLSARVGGTIARASAAMDRLGDMLWDE